jgi:hypothetical protein
MHPGEWPRGGDIFSTNTVPLLARSGREKEMRARVKGGAPSTETFLVAIKDAVNRDNIAVVLLLEEAAEKRRGATSSPPRGSRASNRT